jgi:hypothetical protein
MCGKEEKKNKTSILPEFNWAFPRTKKTNLPVDKLVFLVRRRRKVAILH